MINKGTLKLRYLVAITLICWSIYCVFRIVELADIYELVLKEEYSFYSVFFKEFSILYETIICLFLGIIFFTKKLESIRSEMVWIISFAYALIFFFLLITKTETFHLNRFGTYGFLFVIGFIFNVLYIYYTKGFSFLRTVLFTMISITLAFSLIKLKLFF
jgi:hypothetical protein